MKKVIVVEDNLLISTLYKHYLGKLDYKIINVAITGEKAIEVLKTNEVDLIIMDIMLEGEIDGIEAMNEIRKETNTPVIFASGNSDKYNHTRALEISDSLFLVKPVTESNFLKAVKKVEEEYKISS